MNSWDIDFYAIDQSQVKLDGFFHALWVHLVFWPSLVLHSRLMICDCWWFTEGLFWPLQIRKTLLLEWHWFQCYATSYRKSAYSWYWYAPAWLAQNIVARHFGVHRNTIQSLLRLFRQSGNTRGRQRSGCPRIASRQQVNHIHCKPGASAISIPEIKSLQEASRITINLLNSSQ